MWPWEQSCKFLYKMNLLTYPKTLWCERHASKARKFHGARPHATVSLRRLQKKRNWLTANTGTCDRVTDYRPPPTPIPRHLQSQVRQVVPHHQSIPSSMDFPAMSLADVQEKYTNLKCRQAEEVPESRESKTILGERTSAIWLAYAVTASYGRSVVHSSC